MDRGKRAATCTRSDDEVKKAKGSDFNWVYPFYNNKRFSITPPFINVGEGLEITNLQLNLNIGDGLYYNEHGQLCVEGREFEVSQPLCYDSEILALRYASSMFLDESGALAVAQPKFPLVSQGSYFTVALSDEFDLGEKGIQLALVPHPPIQKNGKDISIKAGNGVQTLNGQLECSLRFLPPLTRRGEDVFLTSSFRGVPEEKVNVIHLTTKTGKPVLCKLTKVGRVDHLEMFSAEEIRDVDSSSNDYIPLRDITKKLFESALHLEPAKRIEAAPSLEFEFEDFQDTPSHFDLLIPLRGSIGIGPASAPALVEVITVKRSFSVNAMLSIMQTEDLSEVHLVMQSAQSWAGKFIKTRIVTIPHFTSIF